LASIPTELLIIPGHAVGALNGVISFLFVRELHERIAFEHRHAQYGAVRTEQLDQFISTSDESVHIASEHASSENSSSQDVQILQYTN
jgi:hypothetical protein